MSGCRHGKLTQWPVEKRDVCDYPNNIFWQQQAEKIEDNIRCVHLEDYDRIMDSAPVNTWMAKYEYLKREFDLLVANTVARQAQP